MDSIISMIYVQGDMIATAVHVIVFVFSLETMAYVFSLIGGVAKCSKP